MHAMAEAIKAIFTTMKPVRIVKATLVLSVAFVILHGVLCARSVAHDHGGAADGVSGNGASGADVPAVADDTTAILGVAHQDEPVVERGGPATSRHRRHLVSTRGAVAAGGHNYYARMVDF